VNILVLNAGSSTLKCAIFQMENKLKDPQEFLWRGILDWGKDRENAAFTVVTGKGFRKQFSFPFKNLRAAAEELLTTAWSGNTKVIQGPEELGAIGHRVVHGGEKFKKPVRITQRVKQTIRELEGLAPLHNPYNLEGIEIAEKMLPDIPQVAVFDTSYHSSIDEAAAAYPGPYAWKEQGIYRYGFHGISHHYCANRAAQLLSKDPDALKIVTCHLGNGSSLAATQGGRCVDTTMGFTPMEGMMMGTRCGSIDPGIILYLLRTQKKTPEEVDRLLNFESGLKGICGNSDMRVVLEKKEKGDPRAALAFSMFVHRLKGFIGSMSASMDGLDVLVFTAGIGENASQVREETCRGLKHLGIALDSRKNARCVSDDLISTENSRVQVYVIHTREEWAIARETYLEKKPGLGRA
jgi:acetate kinase